jgi:hypothetical protein
MQNMTHCKELLKCLLYCRLCILKSAEVALLDFLRSRGEWSDLSPAETNQQLLNHFLVLERSERC